MMKKSMPHLVVGPSGGRIFFELDKDKPEVVLSTKNHTGGLWGMEDHRDFKIFESPNSSRSHFRL